LFSGKGAAFEFVSTTRLRTLASGPLAASRPEWGTPNYNHNSKKNDKLRP
jgi:hypothetical protein